METQSTTLPKIKNAKDIGNLINDESNVKIMKALFQAVAFSETIGEIVEKKQREILAFYKWKSAESSRRETKIILEPKDSYLLDELDFEIYLKELDSFYFSDACPVKPKKIGNCPKLEAESFVRDVKVQVAESFAPYFGFGYNEVSRSLKIYRDYFELLMKMFASKVKETI
jgi:hypothetical protein